MLSWEFAEAGSNMPDETDHRQTSGWAWDPSLYRGSAPFYRAGRLPYAPKLSSILAEAFALDATGRALDVGTGPGIVALELAPLFTQVVGVDPDAAMIEQAELEAVRAGVTNVEWAVLRAEDLPAGLGSFRLVTFAQSFHWTRREEVALTVRGMLVPNGALVLVSGYTRAGVHTGRSVAHPAVPRQQIDELVARYLGAVRRAGTGALPVGTPSDEAAVLKEAGFLREQEIEVPDDRVFTRSVDDVVASVYSVSSSSPHLFAERLAEFETGLRQLLREATPSGSFSVEAGPTSVRIFRPSAR